MKNRFKQWIDHFVEPPTPLKPGIYHYQSPINAPQPFRLHLRIEDNGLGILVVNASTVLHLNQTAAEYAYHRINLTTETEVATRVARRYKIDIITAQRDYADFNDRLSTLINTKDLDPVMFLDMDRSEPHASARSAPLRIDCALTYLTGDPEISRNSPIDRVKRELTTDEWYRILNQIWEAGIPHVVFTGGEPTLRPDLLELISYAEKVGLVTGMITNGYRLIDKTYRENLLKSGLDHLMVVLNPENPLSWECLDCILPEDIFVAVHLTINGQDNLIVDNIFSELKNKNVQAISLSVAKEALQPYLDYARELAAKYQMNLIWDLPVPYSSLNPVSLEVTASDPLYRSGSGRSWLYFEPDGDILPAQGDNRILGNILSDAWVDIWQKANNLYVPEL